MNRSRSVVERISISVLVVALAACQEPTAPAMAEPATTTLSGRPTTITIRTIVGTRMLSVPARRLASSLFDSNGDTRCDFFLPPGAYQNVIVGADEFCFMVGAMVSGNVIVRENATLLAHDNDIRGNVELLTSDYVQMLGNIVGGSIVAEKVVTGVDIHFMNRISGNISVREGTAYIGICGNMMEHGQIILEKNTTSSIVVGGVDASGAPCENLGGGNILTKRNIKVEDNMIVPSDEVILNGLQISNNRIAQDIQVYKNRGPEQKIVTINTVDGNLQCFENDMPITGEGNVVRGNAQGQCKGFVR